MLRPLFLVLCAVLLLFPAVARAKLLSSEPEVQRWSDEQIAKIRKNAETGDADSQFTLGVIYTGTPLCQMCLYNKPDPAEGEKWLHKAAEQGDGRAEVLLAWVYENGHGVKRDYAEAAKWLRKAVNGKTLADDAQDMLGRLYRDGTGVPRDAGEAAKWFQKAAEQNLKAGCTDLSWLYETGGNNLRRDCSAAYFWSLACHNDIPSPPNPLAEEDYRPPQNRVCDFDAPQTAEQKAAFEKRVTEWCRVRGFAPVPPASRVGHSLCLDPLTDWMMKTGTPAPRSAP